VATPKSPKTARVTWIDATRTDDVVTAHDQIGVQRETVGWILCDNSEGIVIAMTRDDGDRFERGFTIPRNYIVSVERLE
jgi:hypothetical protein